MGDLTKTKSSLVASCVSLAHARSLRSSESSASSSPRRRSYNSWIVHPAGRDTRVRVRKSMDTTRRRRAGMTEWKKERGLIL